MGGGERLGKWVLRLALKTGHSLFWQFFFFVTLTITAHGRHGIDEVNGLVILDWERGSYIPRTALFRIPSTTTLTA